MITTALLANDHLPSECPSVENWLKIVEQPLTESYITFKIVWG